MARPRIALLKDLAADLRQSVRRRGSEPPPVASAPDPSTAEELERRLDETHERLKRESPPEGPQDQAR